MTLKQIYKAFPKEQDCINHLELLWWQGKPVCPYCKSHSQTPMPREFRYHCNTCMASFSITARTVFHKTKVDLQKWFYVIENTRVQQISARQLAKDISVTKDTACFMLARIREAAISNPHLLNLNIVL